MSSTSFLITKELQSLASPTKAKLLQGFFKTGKGQYGEGDKFLGVMVPVQRNIAKKLLDIDLSEVGKLLRSPYHECRFTALQILVMKYKKGAEKEKKAIVTFYIKNRQAINNWDLVDTSVPYILGDWLLNEDRAVLYKLAGSKNLWDRRIAIISTFAFIKAGQFEDSIKIAELLLTDRHDLIHKAVGWMLREIGKKSHQTLEQFLNQHATRMPRTMLRYAIEKMSVEKKIKYMDK